MAWTSRQTASRPGTAADNNVDSAARDRQQDRWSTTHRFNKVLMAGMLHVRGANYSPHHFTNHASTLATEGSRSLAERRDRPSHRPLRSKPSAAARPRNHERRVPLDDLDPPAAFAFQGVAQLRPRMAAVRADMAQPRPACADRVQRHRSPLGPARLLDARRRRSSSRACRPRYDDCGPSPVFLSRSRAA